MGKIITYIKDFAVGIFVIIASLFAYFFVTKKTENMQVKKNEEIIDNAKKDIKNEKKIVSDIDNTVKSSPFNRARKN